MNKENHELNTIAFYIYRAESIPAGVNEETAIRHIFENGEMVYEACGIADAVSYIETKGFSKSIVRFTPAQGRMTLTGKAFAMWGSRMAKLVNA